MTTERERENVLLFKKYVVALDCKKIGSASQFKLVVVVRFILRDAI